MGPVCSRDPRRRKRVDARGRATSPVSQARPGSRRSCRARPSARASAWSCSASRRARRACCSASSATLPNTTWRSRRRSRPSLAIATISSWFAPAMNGTSADQAPVSSCASSSRGRAGRLVLDAQLAQRAELDLGQERGEVREVLDRVVLAVRHLRDGLDVAARVLGLAADREDVHADAVLRQLARRADRRVDGMSHGQGGDAVGQQHEVSDRVRARLALGAARAQQLDRPAQEPGRQVRAALGIDQQPVRERLAHLREVRGQRRLDPGVGARTGSRCPRRPPGRRGWCAGRSRRAATRSRPPRRRARCRCARPRPRAGARASSSACPGPTSRPCCPRCRSRTRRRRARDRPRARTPARTGTRAPAGPPAAGRRRPCRA